MKKFILIKLIVLGVFSSQVAYAQTPVIGGYRKADYNSDFFKKIDKDQDGKLSKAEAIALAIEEFDKNDLNKDGYVEKGEIRGLKDEVREFHKKKAF